MKGDEVFTEGASFTEDERRDASEPVAIPMSGSDEQPTSMSSSQGKDRPSMDTFSALVSPGSYTNKEPLSPIMSRRYEKLEDSREEGEPSLSKDAQMRASSSYTNMGEMAGITGLSNLGNTCFMNSVLQAVSNTKELREYFMNRYFKREVNFTNPLGTKGQVAWALFHVLTRLWDGQQRSVAPRQFKEVLGEFAPQFRGYSQHDAQEFMAFLMDAVHEDLNRIKDKKYIELDEVGKSDEQKAQEKWDYHKMRNNSIVVDLFQGLMKSKLTCPKCSHVSTTFDPYMYVSVPIPHPKHIKKTVWFVDKQRNVKQVTVDVKNDPSGVTYADLKTAVAESQGIPAHRCLVLSSRTYSTKICDESDRMEEGGFANEMVFEVAGFGFNSDTFMHSEDKVIYCIFFETASSSASYSAERLHPPLLFYYSQEGFVADLYQEIAKLIEPLAIKPFSEDILNAMHARWDRKKEQALLKKRASQMELEVSELEHSPPPYAAKAGDDGAATRPRIDSTATKETVSFMDTKEKDSSPELVVQQDNVGEGEKDAEDSIVDLTGDQKQAPNSTSSSPIALYGSDDDMRNASSSPSHRLSSEGKTEQSAMDTGEDNSLSSLPEPLFLLRPKQHGSRDMCEPDESLATWKPDRYDMTYSSSYSFGSSYGRYGSSQEEETKKITNPNQLRRDVWVTFKTSIYDEYIDAAKFNHSMARDAPMPVRSTETSESNTLQQCLELFCEEETLGANDAWYCPKCKELQEGATKKLGLWTLPEILVIHLKRFSYQSRAGGLHTWRKKIDNLVTYPFEGLNMSEFAAPTDELTKNPSLAQYDCYAVVNHFGSLSGGHYTAHAKNSESGEWYEFNDSHVSKVNRGEIMDRSNYILFYARKDSEGRRKAKIEENLLPPNPELERMTGPPEEKNSDGLTLSRRISDRDERLSYGTSGLRDSGSDLRLASPGSNGDPPSGPVSPLVASPPYTSDHSDDEIEDVNKSQNSLVALEPNALSARVQQLADSCAENEKGGSDGDEDSVEIVGEVKRPAGESPGGSEAPGGFPKIPPPPPPADSRIAVKGEAAMAADDDEVDSMADDPGTARTSGSGMET